MEKSNSMLVAECLLNHLKIRGIDNEHIIVLNFDNGREQGFRLNAVGSPEVSFAEAKSSDDIVVYVANATTRYFPFGSYVDASNYIGNIFEKETI